MAAIGNEAYAFSYASPTLQNNIDVVLAAVTKSGSMIDPPKNDRNVVMAAVHPTRIWPEVQDDLQVVRAAEQIAIGPRT